MMFPSSSLPQGASLGWKPRERDFAAWKRHTQANQKTKALIKVTVELCQLCRRSGLRFVLAKPWVERAAGESFLRDLTEEIDVERHHLKVPNGGNHNQVDLITNYQGLASRLELLRDRATTSLAGDVDLNYAIKFAHGALTSRRIKNFRVTHAEEIAAEDQAHDKAYFLPEEIEQLSRDYIFGGPPCAEVHAGEDVELPEPPCRGDHPSNHGVKDDHMAEGGWRKLSDDTWANVDNEGGHMVVPTEENFVPEDFPWRSAWIYDQGRWSQIEDEIRWRDLRDRERALPGKPRVVTIFQRKADTKNGRNMRHFPGMQRITLEKMVRRAHEGLGHPERERFLRILRHSRAPEEVIQIAKDLRCSICEAYRLPDPARRSAPPKEQVYVNDLVGIDTIHIRDHRNNAVPAVNIIDWHSHFQLVIPMKGETADHVRAAYRQWTRFFGPPRRLMIDLGSEYKAQFRKQAERDGSEVVPAPVEAPYQRGLTERAGGIFKNILYKAMDETEWKELVDVACMTRNRLLMRAGYSPIQRVLGYTPRLPGGLQTGGEQDHMAADLVRIGDLQARRAMEMRKAAAFAFHSADCEVALRSATLAGPRQFRDYEPGQAVYFWRKGAGTNKKTRESYWHGPGRVIMTALPGAVWIAYQDNVVKAAPERIRPAAEEESLSLSGWLSGLSSMREKFEKMPAKGFLDLTKDADHVEHEEADEDTEREEQGEIHPLPPLRRLRQKTSRDHGEERGPSAESGEPIGAGSAQDQPAPPGPPPGLSEPTMPSNLEDMIGELKRELDTGDQPPGKRTRIEMLELYNAQLQALAKQRQKKESQAKDFHGKDAERLQRAIAKEVSNNLATGAYKLLSLKESDEVRRTKEDKIMESRYVITKKPLEPSDIAKAKSEDLLLDSQDHGPCKAKCRHVMKGFSEAAAVEVECTTPQVGRDSVVFIAQVLASMGWVPGFLDFTQAFHSGDLIDRELYCSQPREGVPGAHPRQLIKLLKTCYGLTDGPLAWYRHLARRLQQDFGYVPSKADPCVFLLHDRSQPEKPQLQGIVGVATDDLLHGGSPKHWANIEKIAREYLLGKNQQGAGRFCGKDIALQPDGSIKIDQEFYVKDKVVKNHLSRSRRQQRYSKCTAAEIEQLRSQLGVLSWLSKETRCDLAGRVSLLQQSFPEPKISDMLEGNKIADEAVKHASLGILVMPIPWKDLRISAVTDAAWGNAKDVPWLEDHPDDYWEETNTEWRRHHLHPRRTTFHPGAAKGGPDLHDITEHRVTNVWRAGEGIQHEVIDDTWCDNQGIRVLHESPWTGCTVFSKSTPGHGVSASKIHSSLTQLQQLSSQGGQIILYHDVALASSGKPELTTIASWKSFRLKRKVVDTLAAEGQSLQAGIGAIHWHRLLFLEAFYGMLTPHEWREHSSKIPFFAAVDSKSLYDALGKLTSTSAYIADKRTAIDLSVIKHDLSETAGVIRWIDTRAMLADPLTKCHPGDYLRYVMECGRWSIVEEGVALQRKALERDQKLEPVYFMVLNSLMPKAVLDERKSRPGADLSKFCHLYEHATSPGKH
eukprot:s5960_g1.t1